MVNYAASYLTALEGAVARSMVAYIDFSHHFTKLTIIFFPPKVLFNLQKYFSSNDQQQSMQLSKSHYTCFSSSSQTKCAVQRTANIAFFTIVVHLFSHPLHERAIKPGNITSLQMSIQNTVCLKTIFVYHFFKNVRTYLRRHLRKHVIYDLNGVC